MQLEDRLPALARHFRHRWIRPVVSVRKIRKALPSYRRYISDWFEYKSLAYPQPLHFLDSYPCIDDRTKTTGFNAHYLYQAVWATKKIHESAAGCHVDIGSDRTFVGILTTLTHVIFVDIRPLIIDLGSYQPVEGSILELPFADSSLSSISSLHVIEHIGLGRYGDQLDPLGSRKAAREITRVLQVGGNLYLSTPVGKSRVMFNAHRVHSPQEIEEIFEGLKLVSFSGVDDKGNFHANIKPLAFANANYACGLYHFAKHTSTSLT